MLVQIALYCRNIMSNQNNDNDNHDQNDEELEVVVPPLAPIPDPQQQIQQRPGAAPANPVSAPQLGGLKQLDDASIQHKKNSLVNQRMSELDDELSKLKDRQELDKQKFENTGPTQGNSLQELLESAYRNTMRQLPYLKNLKRQMDIQDELKEIEKHGYDGINAITKGANYLTDKAGKVKRAIFGENDPYAAQWRAEPTVDKDGKLNVDNIKIDSGKELGWGEMSPEDYFGKGAQDKQQAQQQTEKFKEGVAAVYHKYLTEKAGFTYEADGSYGKNGHKLNEDDIKDMEKQMQSLKQDTKAKVDKDFEKAIKEQMYFEPKSELQPPAEQEDNQQQNQGHRQP